MSEMRKMREKLWILVTMCLFVVLFSIPHAVFGAEDITCAGTIMCDDFEYGLGALKKSDAKPNWMDNDQVIMDATCPFSTATATSTDITVVSSPVRSGNRAIKVEVDACNVCMRSNKWRTEIKSRQGGTFNYGSTYWATFSLWMPSSFVDDGKSEIIAQIHSTDHKFNIHTNGNNLVTNVYHSGGMTTITHSRPKVFDQWVDFKIHFKTHLTSGFAHIYRRDEGESDYTLVASYTGGVGTATTTSYYKLGIYKWSWGNISNFDPGNTPYCGATIGAGVTHRTLYYDAVQIAAFDPTLNFDGVGTGGSSGGDIVVRASGMVGGETITLRLNDTDVQSWTATTSYQNFTHTSSLSSANVKVVMSGGAGPAGAHIDYIQSDGVTYQAEDQEINTGVWQDGSCGGSYSEDLSCSGYIDFGTISIGGGSSNEPPSVSMTSPSNGTSYTVGDAVTIAANASDSDGSISKVEFYQNGSYLGEDTSSPYSYTWNNPAQGSYTLTAKATDDDGASTTSSDVDITVNQAASSGEITIRARTVDGQNTGANLVLKLDDVTKATWSVNSYSYTNYTYTASESSANIKVQFVDDVNGADLQVDYIQTNGVTYQAEDQQTNTAVWTGTQCGGSYSDLMHCSDGYIDFGTISIGGGGGTPGTTFTIEAEDFDAQSGGLSVWSFVGGIQSGDWVRYDDVDLANGYNTFRTNYCKGGTYSSTVEIRLDGVSGTKIGEFQTTDTGGWSLSDYEEMTTSLTGGTGVHDLYIVFPNGGPGNFDWWQFESGIAKTVKAPAEINSQPTSFALDQNYPNPFNPETHIRFRLPSEGLVDLKVYSVQGKLVRDLVAGVKPAGAYSILWNGTDQYGKKVTSGFYIYRINFYATDKTYSESRKMLLLK